MKALAHPPTKKYQPARGFEHMHHHWDATASSWIVHLMPGEYYVTGADEIVATVLGSCVSTCVRDPLLRIGGMNHFMLPESPENDNGGNALRYGGFAVERLINELIKRGADRNRLEIKVFGGGQMMTSMLDIGRSNIDFVHSYLGEEALAILVEDTGGMIARRLRYHPQSGKALVKHMRMKDAVKVRDREKDFQKKLKTEHLAGEVELF